MKKITARSAAFQSLMKCAGGKYSNLETDSAISRYALSGADKNLYTRLVYGTIEKEITLDYIISLFSNIPLEKIDKAVAIILRLGLYQIFFLDRVPDSAAVCEAVELAKAHSNQGAVSFVNALLRSASRNKSSVKFNTPDVKYSLPLWLCNMWKEMYPENCTELMEGVNSPRSISLHINTLKISCADYCRLLDGEGIPYTSSEESPYCVCIETSISPDALPGAADGLFFVQDLSSQICADTLGALPGETVIDTCSCPGGKAFAAAMRMKNNGKIYAFDIHKSKLTLVDSGAERLGIGIIETAELDAKKPVTELFGKADRVICDVPCSGLGVIAKKPDIRHKKPEDITRLESVGREILAASSAYIKSGGIIVFSTCTVNRRENSDAVDSFLASNPEFSMLSSRQIFPDSTHDGFYTAKLVKE